MEDRRKYTHKGLVTYISLIAVLVISFVQIHNLDDTIIQNQRSTYDFSIKNCVAIRDFENAEATSDKNRADNALSIARTLDTAKLGKVSEKFRALYHADTDSAAEKSAFIASTCHFSFKDPVK